MSDRKPGDAIQESYGGAKLSITQYRDFVEVKVIFTPEMRGSLVFYPEKARLLAADLIHFANLIDAQEEG